MSKIHIIDLNFFGNTHAVAAFAVETSEGLVLVETGPYSTFPALRKGVEALGYQLEDIKHVLLSHIHLDHAGAAWALAETGAQIYVHPQGIRHLEDPSRLMQSAKMIYQDEMDRLWGDMRAIAPERLRAVEHGESIVIGDTIFKAWHTPGHAVHHIAWQLGDIAFTGDVGGVRIDGGLVAPPCPPPDIQVEDWQDSIALLNSLNLAAIYLTHFGKITTVATHLSELENRLLSWAAWMKPYYEQQTDPAVVTPLFQAFVHKELSDCGLDAAALARYEVANPSWMSVAGLLRYWKKKAGG